jgi:hypothetical protein
MVKFYPPNTYLRDLTTQKGLLVRPPRCPKLPFPDRSKYYQTAVDRSPSYVLRWRVSLFPPL